MPACAAERPAFVRLVDAPQAHRPARALAGGSFRNLLGCFRCGPASGSTPLNSYRYSPFVSTLQARVLTRYLRVIFASQFGNFSRNRPQSGHEGGVFMRPSPFFKLAFSRSPYYKTRSFSLPYGIASFPSAIPQARFSHPRLLSPRNFPSAAQMKGGVRGLPTARPRGGRFSHPLPRFPDRAASSHPRPGCGARLPTCAAASLWWPRFPFSAAICVFGPVRPCERTSTHAIAQARCRQRTSA